MESASSQPVSFEGAPEDPLLLAEIAKRDKARGALNDEAAENEPTERSPEHDSAENLGAAVKITVPDEQETEESREKALAKEHLVRSVLCTRIAIPSPGSVSNRVLRAVLRGDMEGLTAAINRKRLKGVAVSLTADDRKRTALHMAVGAKNIRMIRALMQWRRELNRSLEDGLDSLGHRRDMFIQEAMSSSTTADGWPSSGGKTTTYDIGRFEKWLSEERRRLVRVTELRCEECWRKAVTARDNMGRTPLHYAVAVSGEDGTLLYTLLTTGRADLRARDASNGRDIANFAALKDKLKGAAPSDRRSTNTASDNHRVIKNADQCAGKNEATNPLVFPVGEEFHRRTGKIRRFKSRRGWGKAEAKGETTAGRDEQPKQGSDSRNGPDGLTAGKAKVKWFCGALERTAETLSGRKGGGAEAFLLSVFEDFDRHGDGTLSVRRFREALDDVNVRVSEQTLLEVGRYFQAPTLKYRRSHQHGNRDSGYRDTHGSRGIAIDCAPFEMSYIPLVDIVFSRKCVREPTGGVQVDGEDTTDDPRRDSEGKPGRDLRREIDQPGGYRTGTDWDERAGGDDRCYVSVGRIRAARVAVIETSDALGRSPIFLAAAAGSVPAVKALIRHGAASSLPVEGTGLTPYSVAPSLLMRRVLAAEARHSLYQAMSRRNDGHHLAGGANEDRNIEKHAPGHELAASLNDPAKTIETQRMETWVSTLAEGEQATTSASETRVDQKTSLHLAATAGLPEAVKDLISRGMEESKDGGRQTPAANTTDGACLAQPAWKTSWKSPEHQAFSQDLSSAAARTTDANGWSALHACCDEASPQHYSCALALLGSQRDPNARTNTGRTPLHVAAIAGGGDQIPLLVSHGADLEARDGDGLRPIHVAAKTGRHVALLALLAAGADAWSVTPRKWNALHYSIAGGFFDATRLLTYWDADSGVLGRQKNSAGVAAMDLGRTNEIRSVTPTLWEAAALGDVEHVSRACLESSRTSKDTTGKPWACPGVNHKTPGLGFTPLHACMAGLAAVTGGVDVSRPCTPPRPRGQANGPSRPSLYARLARGYGRPTRRCGDKNNKNHQKNEVISGSPSLLTGNYLGVCRTLLSAAADVQALDARCRTPLALAAAAGSLEVVEMLIKAGADTRAVDVDGNTPLHFAFAYANVEVGALLSEEGAELEACNGGGHTPQDVAGLCADLAPGGKVL